MTTTARQEFLIRPGKRARLLRSIVDVWAFRGTVMAFAERDVRVKYKQATLGVLWAILQPVLFMTIFTFTLGKIANMSGAGTTYAAFSLSALVPWTYLSGAVTFGANQLVTDAAMIRRVYFPREVAVFASLASQSVDLAIGLVLFFAIGPFLGASVSGTWLITPLLVALLMLLAAGIALPFAALNVYYRDFRFVLPVGMQLLLFASPVAYPLTVIPPEWRLAYVVVNPVAGLLDSFSNVLSRGALPDPTVLGISSISTMLLAVGGYAFFKSLEPHFADVI